MVEDTTIARRDYIKQSEELSLNDKLGHADEFCPYPKVTLPERMLFPQEFTDITRTSQFKVGGTLICSKWTLGTSMNKTKGDLVKICNPPQDKNKADKFEYGASNDPPWPFACPRRSKMEDGERKKKRTGMLWKRFTFRDEEVCACSMRTPPSTIVRPFLPFVDIVKKIYFNDLKSIEKVHPGSKEFQTYKADQVAKRKATSLEFSDRCVINQRLWKPSASGHSYPTNIEGHITIGVEAFASNLDAAGKTKKEKRQPSKDPFLGAKLEIKYTPPGGTVTARSDNKVKIKYGDAGHGYHWELSSKMFSAVGEYMISVTAQDHSGIKLAVAPAAKLTIVPGLPTKAIADWADAVGSNSSATAAAPQSINDDLQPLFDYLQGLGADSSQLSQLADWRLEKRVRKDGHSVDNYYHGPNKICPSMKEVARQLGLDPDEGGSSLGGAEGPPVLVRVPSSRKREARLIRLDSDFPSIVVNFKDAPGNEVKCPSAAKAEVTIECTTTGVTFTLQKAKHKIENGHLLISADSLTLTGELQAVTPIDICAKVFISGQELTAELKAKVTTGPPENMVL
eukprot:7390281-Prymnesium_polylepis.3